AAREGLKTLDRAAEAGGDDAHIFFRVEAELLERPRRDAVLARPWRADAEALAFKLFLATDLRLCKNREALFAQTGDDHDRGLLRGDRLDHRTGISEEKLNLPGNELRHRQPAGADANQPHIEPVLVEDSLFLCDKDGNLRALRVGVADADGLRSISCGRKDDKEDYSDCGKNAVCLHLP